MDPVSLAGSIVQLARDAQQRLESMKELEEDHRELTALVEQVGKVAQRVQDALPQNAYGVADALKGLKDAMASLEAELAKVARTGRLARFFSAGDMVAKLREVSQRILFHLPSLNVALELHGQEKVGLQLSQLRLQHLEVMDRQGADLRRGFAQQRDHMREDMEGTVRRLLQQHLPASVANLATDPQEVAQLRAAVNDLENAKDMMQLAWAMERSLALQPTAGSQGQPRTGPSHTRDPPAAFLCPISQDVMRDPVFLVCSGHTYERANIERWLKDHDTDPVTNVRLESKSLVPNHALRSMIDEWAHGGNQEPSPATQPARPAPSPMPPPAAALHSISAAGSTSSATPSVERLVQQLRSASVQEQAQAAQALADLAFDNAANKASIASAGAVQPLVRLLESGSVEVQRWAAQALSHLVDGSATNQASIARAGAIQPLVGLLGSASVEAQRWAAQALGNLALGNDANKASIASVGALPSLVRLLGATSEKVQVQAARALGSLARGNAVNRAAIASAGAVQPLVDLLGSASAEVQRQAMLTLGLLASGNTATQASIASAGAVPPLVRLLGSANVEVQDNAVWALGKLAEGNATNKARIKAAGAVPQLKLLLKSPSAEVRDSAGVTHSYLQG